MVIAIWSGVSKPVLDEYIQPLVSELEPILLTGIFINNHHVAINFGCVLCDTPARCMVKGVINFNGKHGCQKCTAIGVYSHQFKRMAFPNINAERRSDDSFRKRLDKDHHKKRTPFESLTIDMISAFPTSDSLHLLDLGIMKRCMIRWIYGEKGYTRKWSKNTIANASKLLESYQKYMPVDMHRALRNLDCVKKWKGVEYRTILIYVGMVLLKDILNDEEYYHFLTICCAVRICMCESLKNYWPIAEQMFISFVQIYGQLYGEHSIGSNVHLLSHIVEDMNVQNVDSLMQLSTYKYENQLRLLGMKLRHGFLPLEQVSRRIIEMSQIRHKSNKCNPLVVENFVPQLLYQNKQMLNETEISYKTIKIHPNIILSSKKSNDSWFITKNDQIIKMECAKFEDNKYLIEGTVIANKTNLFRSPINSIKLKIFKSDGSFENEPRTFQLIDFAAKLICLPVKDEFAFIPIINTMEYPSK